MMRILKAPRRCQPRYFIGQQAGLTVGSHAKNWSIFNGCNEIQTGRKIRRLISSGEYKKRKPQNRENKFFSIVEAVPHRCDLQAVPGFAWPERNREEVVDRNRRNRELVEAENEICHEVGEARDVDRRHSIRREEVHTPDYDREDIRLLAGFDVVESAVAGNAPWDTRRVRRNMDPDREVRKDLAEDNRGADKGRVERNDRAMKRRKDREGEDLSAEVGHADNRRVGSRPSDRRRVACNRAHRVRRVVDSDRGRCHRRFCLPFRDPRIRGRLRVQRHVRRRERCEISRRRCRVR